MRVAANGFEPVTQYWPLSGKRELDVAFTGAPIGKVEVTALAYEGHCADAKSGKVLATWSTGGPKTVTVKKSGPTDLTLQLFRTGAIRVKANFDGTPPAGHDTAGPDMTPPDMTPPDGNGAYQERKGQVVMESENADRFTQNGDADTLEGVGRHHRQPRHRLRTKIGRTATGPMEQRRSR